MISAQHNKSLVLRQLKRYNETLEAAIQLAPDNPDNWQRKAKALRKLNRGREARTVGAEVADCVETHSKA